MCSAVERLPLSITELMNLARPSLWNWGSATMTRREIRCRRGISGSPSRLLALGPVLAARLLPGLGPGRVQGSPHDVVSNSRQIFYLAAPDQHHRVLLQVVTDPRDVGGDLRLGGQPPPTPLAERRVGLLGGGGEYAHAPPALLRRSLEGGRLGLLDHRPATFADQLLDGGQVEFDLWGTLAVPGRRPSADKLTPLRRRGRLVYRRRRVLSNLSRSQPHPGTGPGAARS